MRLRSKARWLVAVFAISAFVFAAAIPAMAHHPLIAGEIDCTGELSYTATSWLEGTVDSRHHNDIRIEAATSADGTTWSAFSEIGTGQFTSGNSFTFGDTYQFTPVPNFVQIRSRADGKWGVADDLNGDNEVSPTSPILEVPLCPANPTAVAAAACDLNGAKLTFKNTGGESAQFAVLRNGAPEPTVTVAGGGEETRTYTMVEDTTATFLVTSGVYTATLPITFNCLPAVLAEQGSNVSPAAQVAGDVLPVTGAHDLEYLAVALLLVLAGRGVLSSERLGAGKRF